MWLRLNRLCPIVCRLKGDCFCAICNKAIDDVLYGFWVLHQASPNIAAQTRAVYRQLRLGHSVAPEDLQLAISHCRRYCQEIDITQYLRVQKRHFNAMLRLTQRAHSAVQQALAHGAVPEAEFSAVDDVADERRKLPRQRQSALGRLGAGGGECFLCDEKGHTQRECPRRAPSSEFNGEARVSDRAASSRKHFDTAMLAHFRRLPVADADADVQYWVYAPRLVKRPRATDSAAAASYSSSSSSRVRLADDTTDDSDAAEQDGDDATAEDAHDHDGDADDSARLAVLFVYHPFPRSHSNRVDARWRVGSRRVGQAQRRDRRRQAKRRRPVAASRVSAH